MIVNIQPTQTKAVEKLLQANEGKLVTHQQLMQAADIDTRQRLYIIMQDVKKVNNIAMVKGDGYIYYGKQQETPS